jgi:predicted Zn-dependent protease
MHIAPMPGVETQTVEEMIANCVEGVYVNRFGSLSVTDGASGQLTGVTRDGCLLIKDGKIAKAVKNFRILEAPMVVLNQLLAIGVPERIAVEEDLWQETSFPIIAPPVMMRDFNFSGLSDAV